MTIKRGRRGNTLATILMISSLAFIAAFAMAAVSVSNLSVNFKLDNLQRARDLAESAIGLGMRSIVQDPTFGTHRETSPVQDTPDGTLGLITFDPSCRVNDTPVAWSTNNLAYDTATVGSTGRVIPREAVHLVGVGMVGSATATVEAVMRVPRFPYAISSTGSIQASTPIVVGAVNQLKDVNPGMDPSQMQPGSLASDAGGTAVALQAGTVVTGDVIAVGSINLSGATVKGQVKPGSAVVQIPTVALPDLSKAPGLITLNGDLSQPPALSGYLTHPGNLNVNGDLTLNGAVLRVDGDLAVNGGGIQGQGAVFVSGKTTVTGASHLTTDQVTALVSKGDIQLTGSGKDSSSFTGLVYTEGNFQANSITVIGAFVGNSANGTQVALNDVKIIQVPDLDPSFTLDAPPFIPDVLSLQAIRDPGYVMTQNDVADSELIHITVQPPDPKVFFDGQKYNPGLVSEDTVQITYNFQPSVTGLGFTTTAIGAKNAALLSSLFVAVPALEGDFTPPPGYVGPVTVGPPPPAFPGHMPGNLILGDQVTQTLNPWTAVPGVVLLGNPQGPSKSSSNHPIPPGLNNTPTINGFQVSTVQAPPVPPGNLSVEHPALLYGALSSVETAYFDSLRAQIVKFNQKPGAHFSSNFSVNVGKFIRPADAARLLLWQ